MERRRDGANDASDFVEDVPYSMEASIDSLDPMLIRGFNHQRQSILMPSASISTSA